MPVEGHFQPKFSFVCSIAEHGSFPREGYGVEAGQQPPAFQGKKVCTDQSTHVYNQPG